MSSFWLAPKREASQTPDVCAVFVRSLLSIDLDRRAAAAAGKGQPLQGDS